MKTVNRPILYPEASFAAYKFFSGLRTKLDSINKLPLQVVVTVTLRSVDLCFECVCVCVWSCLTFVVDRRKANGLLPVEKRIVGTERVRSRVHDRKEYGLQKRKNRIDLLDSN